MRDVVALPFYACCVLSEKHDAMQQRPSSAERRQVADKTPPEGVG
jgi:hypothetical protein